MSRMKTSLEKKRKEILERCRGEGFVNVGDLKAGTCIVIETVDENYELEVGTPKFNVVLVASDGRFMHRDKVVVRGSIDPKTGITVPKIIGKGLKIILRRQRKPAVITGPVVNVRIVGKNYEYEMWRE